MTDVGAEENKTPRISFATSIDGALIALGYNLKGKKFYVYTGDLTNQRTIGTSTLLSKNYVPDAHHTGEVWVLDPIRIKLESMIQVIEADKPLPYSYRVGNKELDAEVWSWKYRRINLSRSLII